MISAYCPVLRACGENSPQWYRQFHSTFYMSQLVSQVLSAYVDNGIEDEKEDVIECLKDELVSSKVIRVVENGKISILKENELKSRHVEDVIDQVVERVLKPNQRELDVYLLGMGLERSFFHEKLISVDPNLLLESTTSKTWYELVSRLLNVWEFIFLYGAFESAFKNILMKQGQTREEDLVGSIVEMFPGVLQLSGIQKADYEKIWYFYTELRNVYVHNHGCINSRIKSNLGGKLNDLKKAIINIHEKSVLVTDLDEILKKDKIKDEKFYFLGDLELNIFRNVMVEFIECLESCVIDSGEIAQ